MIVEYSVSLKIAADDHNITNTKALQKRLLYLLTQLDTGAILSVDVERLTPEATPRQGFEVNNTRHIR